MDRRRPPVLGPRRHGRGPRRAAGEAGHGLVWSHYDVAWEEGLAAARGWAQDNGHLLAPLDATFQGYKVGIWMKNTAGRRPEGAGDRAAACPGPAGSVRSRRAFAGATRAVGGHQPRLVPGLAGGMAASLPPDPAASGDRRRAADGAGHSCTRASTWGGGCGRSGWGDRLTTVQQWMCVHVLGIEPAAEDAKPKPRRSQADKWAMNYAAAKQFYERGGHLRVPRQQMISPVPFFQSAWENQGPPETPPHMPPLRGGRGLP
ncbi:helicase associated domain-containing protein [Streptomyces puniciscabiei]